MLYSSSSLLLLKFMMSWRPVLNPSCGYEPPQFQHFWFDDGLGSLVPSPEFHVPRAALFTFLTSSQCCFYKLAAWLSVNSIDFLRSSKACSVIVELVNDFRRSFVDRQFWIICDLISRSVSVNSHVFANCLSRVQYAIIVSP